MESRKKTKKTRMQKNHKRKPAFADGDVRSSHHAERVKTWKEAITQGEHRDGNKPSCRESKGMGASQRAGRLKEWKHAKQVVMRGGRGRRGGRDAAVRASPDERRGCSKVSLRRPLRRLVAFAS